MEAVILAVCGLDAASGLQEAQNEVSLRAAVCLAHTTRLERNRVMWPTLPCHRPLCLHTLDSRFTCHSSSSTPCLYPALAWNPHTSASSSLGPTAPLPCLPQSQEPILQSQQSFGQPLPRKAFLPAQITPKHQEAAVTPKSLGALGAEPCVGPTPELCWAVATGAPEPVLGPAQNKVVQKQTQEKEGEREKEGWQHGCAVVSIFS